MNADIEAGASPHLSPCILLSVKPIIEDAVVQQQLTAISLQSGEYL